VNEPARRAGWLAEPDRHTNAHRLIATSDRNVGSRKPDSRQACIVADLLGDDDRAIQRLRHVLKTRGDVDGIAECSEHGVIAKPDVAASDRMKKGRTLEASGPFLCFG
jgi:hypothetical protein